MGEQAFEPGEQRDDYWLICPYCGTRHGDPWEAFSYRHNDGTMNCGECGREFGIRKEEVVTYVTVPLAAGDGGTGG